MIVMVKVPAPRRECEIAGYLISYGMGLVLDEGIKAGALSSTKDTEENAGMFGMQALPC